MDPSDDLAVASDTTLCSGTFSLADGGLGGVIRITASNVTLTCEGTVIQNTGVGDAGGGIQIANSLDNVTVQGCTVYDYGTGIDAPNASGLSLLNNTLRVAAGDVGNGKGLQMSNNNRSVSDLLVQGNTFSGTGDAMSLSAGASYEITNFQILNNTFGVTIDNINLNGNNATTDITLSGNTYTQGSGEAIGLYQQSGTVVQNETIQDAITGNFLIQNSSNITVQDSTIGTGLQMENADNNTFQRNYHRGQISVSTEGANGSSGNTFQNSIIEATVNDNWTINIGGSPTNTFRNNTLVGGQNYSVTIDNASTDIALQNNIISDFDDGIPAISISADSQSGFTSDYNVFYGTSGNFNATWGATAVTTIADWRTQSSQDANSLHSDPVYTNGAGSDYTLRLGSPAIDAGNPASVAPTGDYAGNARPYGATGRYDVGAYETSTPVTAGVSLSVVPSYTDANGHTMTITVTDGSANPAGTQYAIRETGSGVYLQGDGTTGASEVYAASTSWTHTNLSANTSYAYDFKTANSAKTTITALSGTAVTDTTLPAAPTNVQASAASSSSLSVSWTAPAGTVTSYDMSYGDDASAADTVVTGITGTSATIANLSADTIYYVKIRARNSDGAGPYSSAANGTTANVPPDVPTGLTVTVLSPTSFRVAWTAPAEIAARILAGAPTSYDISYGTSPTADDTVVAGITETSTTVTGLAAATTYYIKVRAKSTAGPGEYSEPASVTTVSEDETPEEEEEDDGDGGNEETPDTEPDDITPSPEEPADDTDEEEEPAPRAEPRSIVLIPDGVVRTNIRVVDHRGVQQASFFAYGDVHVHMTAVMGDVNGDGKPEIITAPQNANGVIHIRVFDELGNFKGQFYPFGFNVRGGASLALADVNGDGVFELGIVPFHGSSNFRVYDLSGSFTMPRLVDWQFVYNPSLATGFDLLAGDVTGNGTDEFVLFPRNRTPNIQVLGVEDDAIAKIGYTFPYPHRLAQGVNATLADIDGDGAQEIAIVPNGNGSANVQVYAYDPHESGTDAGIRRNFRRVAWKIGYTPATHGPFAIASGDSNGDGTDEIVIAGKKGRGGHLQSFDYNRTTDALELNHSFFPYTTNYFGGVMLAMGDADGDGRAELITSTQNGASPNTRVYSFVGRNHVGWDLDYWFWAFAKTARFGTRAVVAQIAD